MGAVGGVVLKELLVVQDGSLLTLRWALGDGKKIKNRMLRKLFMLNFISNF